MISWACSSVRNGLFSIIYFLVIQLTDFDNIIYKRQQSLGFPVYFGGKLRHIFRCNQMILHQSAKPEMEVSGVFSSCETFAENSFRIRSVRSRFSNIQDQNDNSLNFFDFPGLDFQNTELFL